MAQSIKYPPTANFVQKTLGAQLLAGATASATFNNVTSIQNKPGVFIVDRVDANNVETPTKREVIKYTATSGVTATTLTRNADASGTDQDHAVGAIVEFGPDVLWAQSLIDGLTAVVDPATGLLDATKVVDLTTAQVLTNKTLTSPTSTGTDTGAETLTNKTITDSTNNVMAKSLKSATTTVDVSAATAPSTGQVLTATASTTATWQTPTSSATDGWTTSADTFVYASASSFTIAGADRTTTYTKGTRVKFTNNATTYYGVVISSSFSTNTTVNLASNTDYSIANLAITAPYYSYQANPQGYPTFFNYTPTYTGFSVDPTSVASRFRITGRELYLYIAQTTNGTSNATGFTMSAPVVAATVTNAVWAGWTQAQDNGSFIATPAVVQLSSGSSTISVYKDASGAAWTASGGKRVLDLNLIYEI